MTRKLWVSGLATLALVAGTLLSGCSNNGENAGSNGGTDRNSGASTDGGPKEAERKDISVMIYDRGRVTPDQGTIEENFWTKWMNENGPANVKYVAIPRFESADKLNVLYASGSAPDLILEYNQKIRNPLYQQKQLLPLDDLIDEYSVEYKQYMEKYPILRKAGTESDGKLYYFGKVNYVTPNRGVLIRKDWLDKLNLSMPKTTEELYNVVKAFAEQDPDDNGKKDTYGIALSGDTVASLQQMFGATSKWAVQNGELAVDWNRSTDYTAFAKRLFDEALIDRDFSTDNGTKAKQDFINGKLGIFGFLNDPVQAQLQLIDPLKKNVPAAELAFLPYPTSPEGTFLPTLRNPVQSPGAISATAKNPDSVMKYVDFLLNESTSNALSYGVEGTHYETAEGCPAIIDTDKAQKEVSYLTGDMRLLTASGGEITKCDMPLMQYKNDERKQEYQDFYDSFIDTYMTFDRAYPELTLSELMPTLPNDLATIESNADKTMKDIWLKAIVGGSKYTVEKALEDARKEWDAAGGKQVEDWYKNWYENDKDKAILADEVIDLAKQTYDDYKTIRSELN
ncbi:extracellular solute-binding protein [Paenibacillus arenilitoris]|uniref:Extracellular solute-binding protein n=1 Tax=Paenibacillus arenilitoris TaxID=2772299 RepID=A0A927CIU4_9BACL|nr:extracellular solute-binding protein [Paenibacillus arenilitoris]MBD2866976.1 extracellular solute-binding protein [Paenibacillus arenilitoris]